MSFSQGEGTRIFTDSPTGSESTTPFPNRNELRNVILIPFRSPNGLFPSNDGLVVFTIKIQWVFPPLYIVPTTRTKSGPSRLRSEVYPDLLTQSTETNPELSLNFFYINILKTLFKKSVGCTETHQELVD